MDPLNNNGDLIQQIGDIILNLEYWDCECTQNYIHNISEDRCNICNSHEEDCPPSREEEVRKYIY